MASNGRLPNSALAGIPGGRLEKGAAASWLRLRARIGREAGVWIAPTSPRTSYRTFAEQQYFWNLYIRGRGSLAARPGTSNHGWGIAVDTATVTMARLINRFGAEYGWQKRWSDAPSEWWHFRYAPQNDRHKGQKPGGNPQHPYHFLADNEKRWRNVLIRERRIAKHKGGWNKVGEDHVKLAMLAKRRLRQAMRGIAAAAHKDGWRKNHRRVRYNYIKKVVNG